MYQYFYGYHDQPPANDLFTQNSGINPFIPIEDEIITETGEEIITETDVMIITEF